MKITGPVLCQGVVVDPDLRWIEAAGVVTDGERVTGFAGQGRRGFSEAERGRLIAAFGAWPGEAPVADAEALIEAAAAEVLKGLEAPALVGFAGLELARDAAARRLHVAGDGARLAEAIHRPVAWDFTSSDLMLGGAGGPLLPFYLFALAKALNEPGPIAFADAADPATLTIVDPAAAGPEAPGALALGPEAEAAGARRLCLYGPGRDAPGAGADLAESLGCAALPFEALGLEGEAVAAQAYGHLAARVARGLATSCPATTGVMAAVGGGLLSPAG